MSVYKEEATGGVDMEHIYIPLRVIGEAADDADPQTPRTDPLRLLAAGERHVILGDPGSGKSTLLKFLALIGTSERLRKRFGSQADDRLPVLVILRQYADALKAKSELDLLDYVVQTAARDFELSALDREFFEYHLYAGKALLLFDGVDELPGADFKLKVRQRIGEFLRKYPGNTTIVTSRIVGYETEIRYDSLDFSHHLVARLSLGDIEEFVANWYRVRIDNRLERQRHVDDLIPIVHDPESQAIRKLAENPLLLTIICLVHRIDAVLPDERVILYQKCTETLLNTWHTWKVRTEDTRQRGRVEKQNRARMEAIAYWMHSAFDETDPNKRAVVAYNDLLEFLTEYIAEIERPKTEDPSELASLFLRFVRERAGLLIEVGEAKYSFVHLTFQEYLAATHLRKSGETGGISVVWDFSSDRCGNPRWHEVIRLLIGALEKEESQKYLLERIMPEDGDEDFLPRAALAGGCLLDNIAAAEEMTDEILRALLAAAARANSVDILRKPLGQLRTWQDRDPRHKDQIAAAVCGLIEQFRDVELHFAFLLNLVSLGWSDDDLRALRVLPDDFSGQYRLFRILLGEKADASCSLSSEEQELLLSFQCAAGMSSPYGNLFSVVLSAMGYNATGKVGVPPFEQLLCTASYTEGPFVSQVYHVILVSAGSLTSQALIVVWAKCRQPIRSCGQCPPYKSREINSLDL